MEIVKFIGYIQSPITEIKDCPLQEDEGAPQVVVCVDEAYLPAISGLQEGARIMLLTWLHKANRDTLTTKPRNNPDAPTRGVFATRSPDRPNPIGIHTAEVLEVTADGKIRISNLEVLNGTPLIDIKPVI